MEQSDRVERVVVRGGELTVWEWGLPEGPAVVALHGITAHGRSFRALAAALATRGWRVVAPDLRGRGRSRDLPGPWGMTPHADDIAAVIEARCGGRATVLGHSMGGFVAVVLADRHPEAVERLVLVDGGLPLALPDAVLALPAAELVGAVIGPALDRLEMQFASVDAYLAFWRNHPALAPDWGPIVEAYLVDDLVGEAPALRPGASIDAVIEDGASELTSGVLEAALARLGVATTFIAAGSGLMGSASPPLYDDGQLQEFAASHDGVEVVRIPGVNHYTIVLTDEGAAEVARIIGAHSPS